MSGLFITFDGRVLCPECAAEGCFVCDYTGVIDTIDFLDREDVEPVQFIDEEHYT